MKFWYDTEFLENGVTIDLISIGIVAEDGREYYAVSEEMPWGHIVRHEWLMANVVPSLPLKANWDVPLLDRDDPVVKSRLDIRREIMTFFIKGNSPVELWAWHGSYDHICLAQLFGSMVDYPYKVLPTWTNDLMTEVERVGCYSDLPEQQAGLHNALADARHLKLRHDFVAEKAEEAMLRWYHERETESRDPDYS